MRLRKAVQRWWENKRPPHFNASEHLANPLAGLVFWEDRELAEAWAEFLRLETVARRHARRIKNEVKRAR